MTPTVTSARPRDLDVIRSIIESAINAWPAPDRLKRCALPVLAYDALDLEDHEVLLVRLGNEPVAVGAWQVDARLPDPEQRTSTLLHGLYVAQTAQGTGLGRWLQGTIAARAVAAGFHGLHVKAERFAQTYFTRCGYRRLRGDQRPLESGHAYPYWFWQTCTEVTVRVARHAASTARLNKRRKTQRT